MDKIIFERGDENEDGLFDVIETKRITFDITSGLSIYDFKLVCKRLASAIGYQQETIEEVFGDEDTDNKEMIIQAHIHDILKYDVVEKFISGSE